jgi:PAS domain S-box-containing protein
MQDFIEMSEDTEKITDIRDRQQCIANSMLLAIESAKIGTFDWNMVTQQVIWNDYHALLLGYIPTEMGVTYASWESRVHPDDLPDVRAALDRARDERVDYIAEYRVIWPDGSIHWIYARGKFYYDASPRPVRMVGIIYDISDRKQTELDLQQREERMAMAIDAARMGTCDWNILSGEIVWNDYHIKMLDYVPGKIECNYDNWARRVHPADLDRVNAALDLAMASHTDYAAEYRAIWDDGSVRWIYGFGRFYYDREGTAVRMAGIASDITDRKEAELARQASEERLQLAIDGARMGTYDWNLITSQIQTSPLFNVLMGFPPEAEFTFGDWERILHPEDFTATTTALQQAMDELTDFAPEYRIVLPDGSIRWIAAFGRFYGDREGRAVRMAGTINDITTRKQAELDLAASEERMSLTIEAAQIGTFDWNVRTGEIVWNDYHRLFLGYSLDAVASYAAWESRVHPEDLQRVRTAVQLARDTGSDYACEYRILWEDGSLHWLEAFGRFYYDSERRPLRMMGIVNDITDRQQAEFALSQSERRYRALIEATTQIVWSTRADGHTVREQPSWGAFTGQSFEEYRGWGWLEAIHPDDRALTNELWMSAIANLTTYEIEHRLRRHDGEYRYMSVRAVPILAEDGSVGEWVGIHTDITDRKLDETNLRRSEEFNRRILQNNKDCIKVIDLEGRLLYMNDGGKKLMEIGDFAAVYRTSWIEFWQGVDRESAGVAFDTAKAGTVSKFEGLCPTALGTPKHWQVTVAPMFDERGNVEQILSISHDITERIAIESAIRESEDRFRSTFEQAAVGVAHVSLEGQWLLVNQQFCQIVGYTESELLQIDFQTLTPPEDLHQDLAAIRQLLDGEIRTIELEKRYIHKLGHLVWVDVTASLRRNAAGEPIYFIATIADISARKESELALQAQAIELARTTDLVAQRNQELDRFTHIVSHDLKAPLRGIASLAEWIADDLEGEVDPDIHQNLELMRSRVYRMETMINGLLQYARVGNTDQSVTTFAIGDLLAEIIDSLGLPPSFAIELPAALPPITTNRLLLSQVLTNLIGNAWKHHDRPDGRIQVTAEILRDRLWEFTVSDDGPGIPLRDCDRVFGMFQTLSSEKQDSTGIGLSIVKKIVESQCGTISIVAPYLGGTTFRFTWREGESFS